MAIKPMFTMNDINKLIQAEFDKIDAGILAIMQRCGEEFVSDARSGLNIDGAFPKGDYTDQTGNLRSSIGYAVLHDGVIVYDSIHGVEGQAIIDKILHLSIGNKYILIGFAAMEYASYLEAMGYNVIASQSMQLIVDLSDKLKKFTEGKIDFPFSATGVSSALK